MSNPLNRSALRDFRTLKGWSIPQLAERAGIDDGNLYRIERGDRSPSLAMTVKLADTLGVDVASITYPKVNCPDCAGLAIAS